MGLLACISTWIQISKFLEFLKVPASAEENLEMILAFIFLQLVLCNVQGKKLLIETKDGYNSDEGVQGSEESFPIEYGTEYGQRKVGDDPEAGIDYALEALHKQHDPEAGIDFALEALHKQITQNIGIDFALEALHKQIT